MMVENIDKYISELQAIVEYPKVKSELAQAIEKIKTLEGQVQDYRQVKAEKDQAQSSISGAYERAISTIVQFIEESAKPQPSFSQEAVKLGLPEKVLPVLESEVKRRLDKEMKNELGRIWRKELEHQFNIILNSWPKELGQKNEQTIKMLRQKITDNPNVLKQQLHIYCSGCHRDIITSFDDKEIEDLLKNQSTKVTCAAAYLSNAHGYGWTTTVELPDVARRYLLERKDFR
jgi:hypothetical protein